MKKPRLFAIISVSALALTQTVQAIPITGNIGFTGGVTLNTASAATATAVTSWITPIVKLDSGAFASIASGTAATFASGIWNFNTATAIANFWSAGGFTFKLLSSTILQQGGSSSGLGGYGYVVASGIGVVSGNGYDATPMIWNFTTQDPRAGSDPDSWTFSASAASSGSVADGGATVMLLGMALLGLAAVNKKRSLYDF